MSAVDCSCGVPDCRELGWPHEWDPIAAGDSCSAQAPPVMIVTYLGEPEQGPHPVTEPYVRYGSGYACAECVDDADAPNSTTTKARGDDSPGLPCPGGSEPTEREAR